MVVGGGGGSSLFSCSSSCASAAGGRKRARVGTAASTARRLCQLGTPEGPMESAAAAWRKRERALSIAEQTPTRREA
eukprot:scaffold100309_cov33-Tisochrysis_lutea.AAC.1